MVQLESIINRAKVLLTWVPVCSAEEVRTACRSLSALTAMSSNWDFRDS